MEQADLYDYSVVAFDIRAVSSLLPVASRVRSELNATARTRLLWVILSHSRPVVAPVQIGAGRGRIKDALKVCRLLCAGPWGCVMAEFVRFTLDNGSQVLFESAESDLVALHGGAPEVLDGGKLTARLQGVAEAAEEIAGSLRARLVPDEVGLEFGLKISGGVNWFFAKAQGEGTIKVTVKWAGTSASATPPGTGQDPGRG